MKRYKFLNLKDKKIVSAHGDCSWKVGEWKKEDNIDICNRGFHCSDTILNAFSYVRGEVLAIVSTKGKSKIGDDKSVWGEMILDKAYLWTKNDSVALSIFSAELVIKNFEKLYPDDKRPREAIESAKKYLKNPTKKNRIATWSAWNAARSAWNVARSAENTARSADSAAEDAAWSAWNAARSAAKSAWNAESAARSADSAAEGAAWSAWNAASTAPINKKINSWLIKHLKEMKKYAIII